MLIATISEIIKEYAIDYKIYVVAIFSKFGFSSFDFSTESDRLISTWSLFQMKGA